MDLDFCVHSTVEGPFFHQKQWVAIKCVEVKDNQSILMLMTATNRPEVISSSTINLNFVWGITLLIK